MDRTEIIIEPGKQDIVFKRVFDAPRDTVFRVMTDPELVPQWWGPAKYAVEVDTDLRSATVTVRQPASFRRCQSAWPDGQPSRGRRKAP